MFYGITCPMQKRTVEDNSGPACSNLSIQEIFSIFDNDAREAFKFHNNLAINLIILYRSYCCSIRRGETYKMVPSNLYRSGRLYCQ